MSGISRQSVRDEDEIDNYDRELDDCLKNGIKAQGGIDPFKEASRASVETGNRLDHDITVPSVSVDNWDADDTEMTAKDCASDRSLSTADETISFVGTTSIGSAAESQDSQMTSARSAHRTYLSPLRSKRYDGLRSSLSPSGVSSRPNSLSNRSRTSSAASILNLASMTDDHIAPKPTEIFKWTKLRKVTEQLYSEAGRRTFGRPTCFVVSGVLAIGTSKGLLVIYDYQQVCKHVIGGGSSGKAL